MTEKVNKIIGGFLVFLMGLITVDVLWQVFSRYILGNPSSFTDELARFLLIWIGVLGAAYVAGKNDHLAIDLISNKVNHSTRKRIHLFIDLVVILFVISTFIVGGSRLVYLTLKLGQNSSALQVPLGFVYMIIPFSGILILYYKIVDLLSLK